jgi:uncharacterized protein YbjT (DUF2867 family)
MNSKILVTGATGTVGQEVVKALQKKQADFVVGVRDAEKAKRTLGEVKTVAFNWEDPTSFGTATEGVQKVFVLGPPVNPNLGELVEPFLDHLNKKGIKRVVYLSAMNAEKLPTLPFHVAMEEKLKQEGFDYTVLRPSFFSQNFKTYEYENLMERGVTYNPAGQGKASFVDVQDIGEVAAVALTDEGHSGKVYELTGPEALSYSQAADELSQILGKKIVYPAPSPQEYKQTLLGSGAPEFVADYMIEITDLVRQGHAARTTDHVEQLLGRRPHSFRQASERIFG